MAFRQPVLDAIRGVNTGSAGATYNPNIPIPRPGQPTNSYQITPNDFGGRFSPEALAYVNQDITAFNTPQTIPGGMPPSRIPSFPPQQSAFSGGPFAQQAMRMAGLLGNVPAPQQPTMGYHGLLGGPKRGLQIPGGK